MAEFDLIARYLAPLSGEGAFGLRDDAAVFADQVITKDILVEGVHFLPTDPLDMLARKALRVNISDLIAKGATPTAYFLGMVWQQGTSEEGFALFADGLRSEQEASGFKLLGGDTTTGPAMVISITMVGQPGPRGMIGRNGAQPGDALMVSGTIGDGRLGLEAAQLGPAADDSAALPYRLPAIPLGLQTIISEHATASLDVSDGLIADAGHLAKASGVGLRIDAEAVPLSSAGRAAKDAGRIVELVTGGDDYQTLFSVPQEKAKKLQDLIPQGLSVTKIGEVLALDPMGSVELVGEDGAPIEVVVAGWDHFSSR